MMEEFRALKAIRDYLEGKGVEEICNILFYTDIEYQQICFDFVTCGKLIEKYDVNYISERLNINKELVVEYVDLWKKELAKGAERIKELSDRFENPLIKFIKNIPDKTNNFIMELRQWFDFSPAKAEAYVALLEKYSEKNFRYGRKEGEIVYHAVSSDEPPGKPLAECRIIPVVLPLVNKDDIKYASSSIMALKWEKILRLTTFARAQGASLNQADLAFLLGVDFGVIQRLIQANHQIIVPLRGNMLDIGPGITHMKKIISLYMQGYTETEIKGRTGHSYESIEEYIRMFSAVLVLRDRKMPPVHMRQAIGCSMKLVESYIDTIKEYDLPEYTFKLNMIRQIFFNTEVKQKKNRFNPGKQKREE
jgi:hypothetical protein